MKLKDESAYPSSYVVSLGDITKKEKIPKDRPLTWVEFFDQCWTKDVGPLEDPDNPSCYKE